MRWLLRPIDCLFLVIFCAVAASLYGVPLMFPNNIGTAYIIIHFVMTAVMLVLWAKGDVPGKTILWTGIAVRILLMPLEPITSNDAERYLWDGAVALAGLDPYSTAPDDPVAQTLRKVWPTPLEHGAYATIYPPGAVSLFMVSAVFGPQIGPFFWKGLITGAGLLSLLLIYRLMRRQGHLKHFALFALSPLLILETGVGAHLDSLLVLAVVAALYFFDKKHYVRAGFVLGWGSAVKFLPIVFFAPLALWLWQRENFMKALKFVAAGAGVFLSFYGTALLLGVQPVGVVKVFFEKWRNGSPFFLLLDWIFDPPLLMGVLIICALAMISAAVYTAFKGRLLLPATLLLAVPLTLSPVVFPWYLSILIPVLALRPTATLLLWVSTAPLSYVVLNDWLSKGIWDPPVWPLWVLGFAILAGLVMDGARLMRRQ